MARPKATELTSRELAVMQLFWKETEATAEDAHQYLQQNGDRLAYVTVANVVRALVDKGFLHQTSARRPYSYKAKRSFEQVSKTLIGDLVTRLFEGSRETMLVHLLDRHKLTRDEREYLQQILERQEEQ